MTTVVLVGTLDTKGVEYGFLRDRLREAGVDVVIVDAGVLGEPAIEADVPREEVARAGGGDHAALVEAADRGAAPTASPPTRSTSSSRAWPNAGATAGCSSPAASSRCSRSAARC